MSLIVELMSRIENLPQLQKKKRNNEKVVVLSQRMEVAFNDLSQCIDQRRSVLVVFPSANLKKTIDALKQSKRQATLLLDKLQADFDEVGSPDTNQKIFRIKERNDEALDQIRKEWKRCVDEELKYFVPLIEIVRSIPGNEALVESFVSIQNRASLPPSNADSAAKFRDDLEQLRVALGQLKLEGPGGQFLKRAVNGRASAKELLDKEVQEFLETNNLWEVLTIRVGR